MIITKLSVLGIRHIVITLVLLNLQCAHYENKKLSTDCDSINKADLLMIDILKNKNICTIFGVDTNYYNPDRFNYLVSDGFIEPGKVFYAAVKPPPSFKGPDSIKVISIDKDSIRNNEIGHFFVKVKQTNSDTTQINLVVDYTLLGRIPATESTFEYVFDKRKCMWVLQNSTFDRY